MESKTTTGIKRSMDGGSVRFEFGWGWMTINPTTGAVDVSGPGVNDWFDSDRACTTACTLMTHAPWKMRDEFDAIAQAVNLQFASWKGMRTMRRAS